MADQNNIADYIQQSRAQGVSDEDIRKNLTDSGWKTEDITAALSLNSQLPINNQVPEMPTSHLSWIKRVVFTFIQPQKVFSSIQHYGFMSGFTLLLLCLGVVLCISLFRQAGGIENIDSVLAMIVVLMTLPVLFLNAYLTKVFFRRAGFSAVYKDIFNILAFASLPFFIGLLFTFIPFIDTLGGVILPLANLWSLGLIVMGFSWHFKTNVKNVLLPLFKSTLIFFFILAPFLLVVTLFAGLLGFASLLGGLDQNSEILLESPLP